jgi:hypothetical protein
MEMTMRVTAFILLSLLVLPVAACAETKPAAPSVSAAKSVAPVTEDYICPMHPDVHGKKGDVCPICGMTMVLSHHEEDHQATPVPQ